MSVDVPAARNFLYANARLLDRHRLAALGGGGSAEPVLLTLRAYRNADGGFGHALEPDVRSPTSEPTATLQALLLLVEADAAAHPMVVAAAEWISRIADADGGVPFVLPSAEHYPRGPWMVPTDGGSHLTFALAAVLSRAGADWAWLDLGTEWCWAKLTVPEDLNAYWLKFALQFLDASPEDARARQAIESLRPLIGADGFVPVPGGTADERLTPVDLSARPGLRSRALFTDSQIAADLDRLEAAQQDDGGWLFDWLAWSPGQSAEWRGIVTLEALITLRANRRIAL